MNNKGNTVEALSLAIICSQHFVDQNTCMTLLLLFMALFEDCVFLSGLQNLNEHRLKVLHESKQYHV